MYTLTLIGSRLFFRNLTLNSVSTATFHQTMFEKHIFDAEKVIRKFYAKTNPDTLALSYLHETRQKGLRMKPRYKDENAP